jgi:hypothetical protein
MVKTIKRMIGIALMACAFNAASAPVTLVWVNTPVTRTISWFDQNANNFRGGFVFYEVSTASVAGSITLPDASVLDANTVNLYFDSQANGQGGLSANVQASLSGYPVPSELIPVNSIAARGVSFDLADTRLCNGIVTSCSLTLDLTRDTQNPFRFYGDVGASILFNGNGQNSTLSGSAIGDGRYFAAPFYRSNAPGTSSSTQTIPVVGYWEIAGTSDVPLPGSLALCFIGLAAAASFRKFKNT